MVVPTYTTPFGELPSAEDYARYSLSSNFRNGEFVNLEPAPHQAGVKAPPKLKLVKLLAGLCGRPPGVLPCDTLQAANFAQPPTALQVVWMGHSFLLIDLGGIRIMTDPVFGYASPLVGTMRRFVPPPLALQQLPPVDVVIISHDHYDHLEKATIEALSPPLFVCPLGVGARLRGWGKSPESIVELDWHQEVVCKGVSIRATPSRHFSGRSFKDRNKTLWASWVMQSPGKTVFFSADGGYGSHFAHIGKEYGPFDLALMEVGAWSAEWPCYHMFPAQAVQAAKDLRAQVMMPIHWAGYALSYHTWDEPILQAVAEAHKAGMPLITPRIGQPVVPGESATGPWWEKAFAGL